MTASETVVAHTPGPWSIDTGRPGQVVIVAPTGAQRLGDPRYVELARVMVKTNARLIAAAPDGLEAARFALSVLQANPVEMSERMAIEKLEAFIAKATGATS